MDWIAAHAETLRVFILLFGVGFTWDFMKSRPRASGTVMQYAVYAAGKGLCIAMIGTAIWWYFFK